MGGGMKSTIRAALQGSFGFARSLYLERLGDFDYNRYNRLTQQPFFNNWFSLSSLPWVTHLVKIEGTWRLCSNVEDCLKSNLVGSHARN